MKTRLPPVNNPITLFMAKFANQNRKPANYKNWVAKGILPIKHIMKNVSQSTMSYKKSMSAL